MNFWAENPSTPILAEVMYLLMITGILPKVGSQEISEYGILIPKDSMYAGQ